MIVSKSDAQYLLGKKLKGLGAGRRSYYVLSEDGTKNLGGPYTKDKARGRLGQVEYFKHNPTPADSVLYAMVVRDAKKKFDVWPSIYASSWVVREYKKRGGRYINPAEGLDKWFAEKWVDLGRSIDSKGRVKSWVECGRPKAGEGAYPKCVPLKKAKKMTPAQRLSAVRRKRLAESSAPKKKGRKPVMVKTIKDNPRKRLYIYPNEASKKVAKRALERRKKLPRSKRGGLDAIQAGEQGIGSGVMRARDIASGKRINAYQVKAFFDRHRHNYVNARAQGKKWEDSKAWQAWDLWGGEPLRKQVEAAVRRDKKERDKMQSNPSSLKKDVKKLLKDAESKGCKVIKGKRHYKVRCPEGDQITVSASPSDHRVLHKIRKDFRKVGILLKNPGREPNPASFEDRPHNWDEVLIQKGGVKKTRRQIRDYYRRNENKIWRYLEGQTVMVILAPKKNQFVRRRHLKGKSFIKLTKRKGINDPNSFEYWINRRVIEFHPTLTTKSTPILWLDLDMHSTKSEANRKKLLREMRKAVPRLKKVFKAMGVRRVHVYSSGVSGGLHLEGDFDRSKPVDALRRRFTKALKEEFADDPIFTTGIAKSGQIRLDTTTLHTMGSLRAPYSMTVTGSVKRPVK